MKKDTFVKGAVISTVCIILAKILGIIYVIPFNAIIGEAGGSLYGYAYNIYNLFLNLSTVGIPLAISKLVSEYSSLDYMDVSRRSYKVALTITSALALVCTLVLIIFAPSLARMIKGDIVGGNSIEDISYVIRISASAILITTILADVRGYLQGQKYIKHSSISQVIEQFVRIIVIIAGSYIFIKLFGVKEAVGIAIFGATIGGLVGLVYLYIVHRKNLKINDSKYKIKNEEKKITNKVLVKKLVTYSIPLIIMSVIVSLYIMVDLSTVIKCLVNKLGYKITNAEYIMSCISTWGAKLNVIVTSISTGIGVSLLPNIAADFSTKNYKELKNKTENTIITLLFIVIPMVFGLSVLASPVWNIFYGVNKLGVSVFSVSIFTALFCSLFNIVIIIMQSVNRYKKVYLCLVLGILTKIIINVPMMLLFDKIGLNAYWGASISTMLGYVISLIVCFIDLKKQFNINVKEILKSAFLSLIAAVIMFVVIYMLSHYINFGTSRFMSILEVILYVIIGIIIYGGILFKTKTFKKILSNFRR